MVCQARIQIRLDDMCDDGLEVGEYVDTLVFDFTSCVSFRNLSGGVSRDLHRVLISLTWSI